MEVIQKQEFYAFKKNQEFQNINQNAQNRLLTNTQHVPLYPTTNKCPLMKKKAVKNYKFKLYLHILMI